MSRSGPRHELWVFVLAAMGCNPTPAPPGSAPGGAVPASGAPPATQAASAAPAPSAQAGAVPIDALVARLGKTQGLWVNGTSAKLGSPADAKIEVVLRELFGRMSLERGPVKTFEILEERDVTIPPEIASRHAVRLRTEQGEVVVLMRFEPSMGWWTRAYATLPP